MYLGSLLQFLILSLLNSSSLDRLSLLLAVYIQACSPHVSASGRQARYSVIVGFAFRL